MSTMIENRLWDDILHAVEKRLNRQSFETWFRPIRFEGFDNSEQILHLRAPNQVVKDWVSTNYSDVLVESLEELNLAEYHVDWLIEDEEERPAEKIAEKDDQGVARSNTPPETVTTVNGKASSLFPLLGAVESDGLPPAATTFVDIEP